MPWNPFKSKKDKAGKGQPVRSGFHPIDLDALRYDWKLEKQVVRVRCFLIDILLFKSKSHFSSESPRTSLSMICRDPVCHTKIFRFAYVHDILHTSLNAAVLTTYAIAIWWGDACTHNLFLFYFGVCIMSLRLALACSCRFTVKAEIRAHTL